MNDLNLLLERLDRIENTLSLIVRERTVKERYTTTEAAEILGKADYTIREYCRKGQIRAEKSFNGRGWLIPHEELQRVRNYGPRTERE